MTSVCVGACKRPLKDLKSAKLDGTFSHEKGMRRVTDL
jgi:hypothetical protein